uniref:Sphingomyelin phosphodiesterase n=1 Tax=Corvus moneduloides TaxID=1196302 RepID=A0A8C3D3T0_CORMO
MAPSPWRLLSLALAALSLALAALSLLSLPVSAGSPLGPGEQLVAAAPRWGWRNLSCPACRLLFGALDLALQLEPNVARVGRVASRLCQELRLARPPVCRQAVQLFQGDVVAAWARSVLRPPEACGLLLGPRCGHWDILGAWNLSLPATPKPPVRPPAPPPPGAPTARILFLTDLHWDRQYVPGSAAACPDPLCCRGAPRDGPGTAGFWGTYSKCDLPLHTIDALLAHGNGTSGFAAAYWTGDILRTTCGSRAAGPAAGTAHRDGPAARPPGGASAAWLYDAMAEAWQHWLPPAALHTLRAGGFYTAQIWPGLRLVSLNMNFCSQANFWLLINATDPAGQLQWLMGVLADAEHDGEKVHIIGHIPPAHCLRSWSWNYYRIVNRSVFEGTIAAQFFGTRTWTSLSSTPIPPALTVPPAAGYRVYEVAGSYPGSSHAVLDHETFILNLTEANARLYSAREAYGLPTAFPADWDLLVRRMQDDEQLFQRFWFHLHKGHPPHEPCGSPCKAALLCALRTGRAADPALCRPLRPALPFPRIQELWHQQRLC